MHVKEMEQFACMLGKINGVVNKACTLQEREIVHMLTAGIEKM
jgi:hypothetical protein